MTSVAEFIKIIVGKRWPLILGLFLVELALIFVVANAPFSPNEYNTYYSQYKNITPILYSSPISQTLAIFENNLRVALIEVIPIVGVGLFGLSIYETARIVEVIGIAKGVGSGAALLNLFILPSTWLELPAYCIATAESIFLTYAVYRSLARNRGSIRREISFFLVTILMMGVVLIVAATIEVTEIQLEAVSPALSLVTWLPAIVILVLVVRFWRRARMQAPAIEERDNEEKLPHEDVGGGGVAGQGAPVGEHPEDGPAPSSTSSSAS